MYKFYNIVATIGWQGGLTQLVVVSDQDPKEEQEGLNPVRSPIFLKCFSKSKMLCWLAVGVPNPHVSAQKCSRTHVKDPVVHHTMSIVRVRWITETWKDPARTEK